MEEGYLTVKLRVNFQLRVNWNVPRLKTKDFDMAWRSSRCPVRLTLAPQ